MNMSFKKSFLPAAVLVLAFFGMLPSGNADAAVGATCNDSSGTFGTCYLSCSGSTPTPITDVSGVCTGSELCCAAAVAGGGGAASSGSTVTISNPLAYNTVQDLLGKLLDALQGIIVTLSLVFIVIGAVLYVTSAGDEGRIKTAKAAITASLIGLAIGIAAPSFLKEISVILGWTGPSSAAVTAAPTLLEILTKVLDFLLSMIGVLAIIMLVWGGVMYLTSAGDEKRADTAKAIVKWALVGIAVALASLVLVTQVANFF